MRGAYAEMLARDRHPDRCAMFIEMPPELVDVNVHPAKTEVRFREPAMIRGMIVSGLRRRALDEGGFRAVQRPAEATMANWQSEPVTPDPQRSIFHSSWPAEIFQSALPFVNACRQYARFRRRAGGC